MLLAWYYHFAAETILGATAALSAASVAQEAILGSLHAGNAKVAVGQEEEAATKFGAGVPSRMVIPWVEGWRDQYGIQEVLARGIWGDG
jgi:hypothetical protein